MNLFDRLSGLSAMLHSALAEMPLGRNSLPYERYEKKPTTDKRAKIKAARKQKHRK